MHIRRRGVDVCHRINAAGRGMVVDERPAVDVGRRGGVIFKALHIRQGGGFTTRGEVGGNVLAFAVAAANCLHAHVVVGERIETAKGNPSHIAHRNRSPGAFRNFLVFNHPFRLGSARSPRQVNVHTVHSDHNQISGFHTSAERGEISGNVLAKARGAAVGLHTHLIMGVRIKTNHIVRGGSHIHSRPVSGVVGLVFHRPGNLGGITGGPSHVGGVVGDIRHGNVGRFCTGRSVTADDARTGQLDVATELVEVLGTGSRGRSTVGYRRIGIAIVADGFVVRGAVCPERHAGVTGITLIVGHHEVAGAIIREGLVQREGVPT